MDAGEIGAGGRVALDGDVMQLGAALRVALPAVPGGQKVVAETEACIEDHEMAAAGPTRGQAIAVQKDFARLRQRVRLRQATGSEVAGPRLAVRLAVEDDARRFDRPRFHVITTRPFRRC